MGVCGMGCTKASAFEQAALALTAVVADPGVVGAKTRVEVDCEASDDELLLFEWLNALVFEMSVRKMLFSRFRVELREGGLTGEMWGESVDQKRHCPATEVKGATFTTLSVHKNERGHWVAQTVVDV